MPTRSASHPSRPRQSGQHEDNEARQQPKQRVALLQPPAPDQLEDHDEEHEGGDGRSDGDAKWGHSSSGIFG